MTDFYNARFDGIDGDGFYADGDEYVSCKYCGTHELHWSKHNKKWALFNELGNLHVCKPSKEQLEAFPLL